MIKFLYDTFILYYFLYLLYFFLFLVVVVVLMLLLVLVVIVCCITIFNFWGKISEQESLTAFLLLCAAPD